MWKRKDDEEAGVRPPTSPGSYNPGGQGRVEASRAAGPLAGTALIGKSVVIKGELSGSEDLYLDGSVEGTIELRGNNLVVGPNGRVRAGIHARGVIIEGKVDGKIEVAERVELRKTAVLVGNVVTQRIAIEDGAFFKGTIEMVRQAAAPPHPPRTEVKREPAPAAASAAATAGTSGEGAQTRTTLVEQKKP